jgi:hypothetical protein
MRVAGLHPAVRPQRKARNLMGLKRKARNLMGLTPDRNDPCLREVDPDTGMQKCYLILSDEERAKGFVRPVRRSYKHLTCGTVTTMAQAIAETYARQPSFYGATYCVGCRTHLPVGVDGEFVWAGTDEKVGS